MTITPASAGVRRLEITLFEFAQKFQGLREVPGQKDNPAILAALQLDDEWPQHDEVAWCSAAMNSLCWLLGLPRSKSLMARSWLNVGRGVTADQARMGWDIVVLWRGSRDGSAGHVGIFAGFSRDGKRVRILGGNQADQFNIQEFPLERVLGYRRLFG